MPTVVRLRRDNVPMHFHPTLNNPEGRWHGPWERHPTDTSAHLREGAGFPTNFHALTLNEQTRYLDALNGETLINWSQRRRDQVALRPNVRTTVLDGEGFETAVDQRQFGVEIECFTDIHAFIAAAARKGVSVKYLGYYTHQTEDTWKLVSDSSVRMRATDATRNLSSIEVVSPILRGSNGLAQLKAICEALAEVGTRINRTCGLHVHHDATEMTIGNVKKLVRNFSNIQPALNKLVAASRRENNRYCGAFYSSDLSNIEAFETLQQLSGINRYKNLNVAAYHRHHTVEFRQHQGTFEFDKIAAWVQLGQRIIDMSVHNVAIAPIQDVQTMLLAVNAPGHLVNFFARREAQLARGGN